MRVKKISIDSIDILQRHFSSEFYENLITSALDPLDLLYTFWFRYPFLRTRGIVVDAVSTDPEVVLAVTLLFTITALVSVVNEYKKEMDRKKEAEERHKNSHKIINKKLNFSSINERKEKETEEKIDQKPLNEILAEMLQGEDFIKNIFKKNKKLTERYANIEIIDGNIQFTLKEKTFFERMLNVASDSWITLCLFSFSYWVLWIGCAATTGDFFIAPGIGDWGLASFIIPTAVAGMYPFVKIRNWWKNQVVRDEEKDRVSNEMMTDATELLQEIIFNIEKNRLGKELTGEKDVADDLHTTVFQYSLDHHHDVKIPDLYNNMELKTVAAFFTHFIFSYSGAQYGAWVIFDFLKIAANVTVSSGLASGLGLVFLGCSLAYSLYKTWEKYYELKEHEGAGKEETLDEMLKENQEKYTEKCANIQRMLDKCGETSSQRAPSPDQVKAFYDDKEVVKIDNWILFRKGFSRCFRFLCGATSGVYLARIVTISGTVTFLPFSALALSNPLTIAILVLSGITYGVFKVVLYHQGRHEARVRERFERRLEKMKYFSRENELADLKIQIFENKLKNNNKKKNDTVFSIGDLNIFQEQSRHDSEKNNLSQDFLLQNPTQNKGFPSPLF